MNRREALKHIALLSGGALSLSTIAGVMGGCRAGTGGSYAPQTLTQDQFELVAQMADLIIPPTDTPGAKAAGVQEFIDHMLTNWNTKEEREHFLEGLKYVDEVGNENHGSAFMDLDEQQQINVLERLEQEAEDNPMHGSDLKPFFSMMKEYTITGYYTSEIGADQELQAGIVPGYYDACVPYSEIGTAWS